MFLSSANSNTKYERTHVTGSHLHCPLSQDVGCENCNLWLEGYYAASVGLDYWCMYERPHGPPS